MRSYAQLHGLQPAQVCALAGCGKLYWERLTCGANVSLSTMDRVRAYMSEHTAPPFHSVPRPRRAKRG
ncbi:hypothetical protein CCC_02938 [Paramagnetospirillum magnetotacticum MS-1]|uniref:Uncharacterized protein n=1 Tax=Paramagnetospirillum magnetotacticum MS-1 TaxID=272627 RepID=A0A0C2YK76_PARME|nr:hypothetical protein CCC_02938 [Paramagnetospirillum magnetotacticum MS-1]